MSIVAAGIEPAEHLNVQKSLAKDKDRFTGSTAVLKIVLEGRASPPTETMNYSDSSSSNDDKARLQGSIHDDLQDWSGTGRGTLVHFKGGEKVPLGERECDTHYARIELIVAQTYSSAYWRWHEYYGLRNDNSRPQLSRETHTLQSNC